MICDICKNTESYIKEYNHIYTIKGKKIEFKSKRRFCKNCNNLVYDSELDNNASEIAISLYNKQYGIPKEEIINFRKKYNLSQDLFSKIIGCAKKTLISYEKGKSIPNDSYLILIKSLISKPETILTILGANKEQFSDKEYNKINNKLSSLVKTKDELDMYNGYTKLLKDKIYNMILFFSDKGVLKTKLLKEMFYADFLNYKTTCKSITGLEYCKITYGPVPEQYETILNECYENKIIDYNTTYKNEYECHNIISKTKFDRTLFTKEELEIMKKVKNKFLLFTSKEIADYSHNEKAFIETEYSKKISYDYSFDIDIDK